MLYFTNQDSKIWFRFTCFNTILSRLSAGRGQSIDKFFQNIIDLGPKSRNIMCVDDVGTQIYDVMK